MIAANLPDSSVEIDKFELIRQLEVIRAKFIQLQYAIISDAIHRAEAEAYQARKKQGQQPQRFTDDFQAAIIDPLNNLIAEYEAIKLALKQLIDVSDYEYITKIVSDAATAKTLPQRHYYHDAYQQTLDSKITEWQAKRKEIKKSYSDRLGEGVEYGYSLQYCISGVLSIFGIGIPYLLTVAITHAIDTLITAIRKSQLTKKIDKSSSDADKDTYTGKTKKNIQSKIDRNIDGRLKQSFFKAEKANLSPTLEALYTSPTATR